jgi:thiol-disulfide isomerase/thioredoxin
MSTTQRLNKKTLWVLTLACVWGLVGIGGGQAAPVPDIALPAGGAIAPELSGAWLNVPRGTSMTMQSRRGRVTIVHFWTFGCINCKRNLPHYAQWQKEFGPRGVAVIGIHTPETAGERNVTNVINQVKALGITYPVLLDPEAQNWKRWGQRCWPTAYLIDKQGRVRIAWEGELQYGGRDGFARATQMIEVLLKE